VIRDNPFPKNSQNPSALKQTVPQIKPLHCHPIAFK
jgi:hypothetical protein